MSELQNKNEEQMCACTEKRLSPPSSPTTDAAHAIFFSQTLNMLRDESTVQ